MSRELPPDRKREIERLIDQAIGAPPEYIKKRAAEREQRRLAKLARNRPADARKHRNARNGIPNAGKPGPKPGSGRPVTAFDQTIADAILDRVIAGATLTSVCALPGFPSYRVVMRWAESDPDGFGPKLSDARAISAEAIVDLALDAMDAADGRKPDRDRVLLAHKTADIRLRVAAKRDPRKFSERNVTNQTTLVDARSVTINDDKRAQALALVLNRARLAGGSGIAGLLADVAAQAEVIEAEAIQTSQPERSEQAIKDE